MKISWFAYRLENLIYTSGVSDGNVYAFVKITSFLQFIGIEKFNRFSKVLPENSIPNDTTEELTPHFKDNFIWNA